ncbi:MAG: hypothetical protein N3A62_09040 [Thermodesulfovibrionales bacterium]|nr:hypothetical protein [Thermodesulfovibrionales bacterium]
MNIHIHPLILLFGAELIIILIVATIVFFFKMRKYKKLYQDSKRKDKEQVSEIQTDEKMFESADADLTKEVVKEIPPLDTSDDETAPTETTKIEDTAADEIEKVFPTEKDLESEDSITKLKKIIDFQKQKIVDLMCYKDILESAEKRLTNIHSNYQELAQKFTSIAEVVEENKEFELTLEMFGENTSELRDFIEMLKKENDTLLEKFNSWQEQLKTAWQESDEIEASAVSGDIESILKEKHELAEKLKEFEQMLNQKTKQLQEAQTQYEDLEKEYMTLYRQQQGG